ncbi:MAG: ABC transporter permease [Eubacteriales bacterium]|nr:ABC transporter permease [Eubacteriales bacterium]
MILYSFNETSATGPFTGFTVKWYESAFRNQKILDALAVTFSIAGIATVVSTVFGTLTAIGIFNSRMLTQKIVTNVTYVPMLNPDIVTGISIMLLFVYAGIPRGYMTMLMAHITFCLPYVIFSVLPKLRQLDPNLYEAALDLGARPGYALGRVVIPQIMPGIITGALLAFTMSIDDFAISFFTSDEANLSIYVYSAAKRGIKPEINAISTVVFFGVLALLIIINFRKKKEN